MADHKLDDGFEEIPLDHHTLDDGFQEVNLHPPASVMNTLHSAAAAVPGIVHGAQNSASSLGSMLSDAYSGLEQGATLSGADEYKAGNIALLDRLQSLGHQALPDMVPASPVDVDKQLASQGFTGDLTTNYTDLYRQEQQKAQAEYEAAHQRHPWAYTAAQMAGGLLPALAIPQSVATLGLNSAIETQPIAEAMAEAPSLLGKTGALATQLGKRAVLAAPVGAAMGALGSEKGALIGATPEQRQQLASDTEGGAATGTVLAAVGAPILENVLAPAGKGLAQSASESVEKLKQDSPLLRQASTAFDAGKQGIGYQGEKDIGSLLDQSRNVAENATNSLFEVRDKLGGAIRNFLTKASDEGRTINLNKETLNNFDDLINMGPSELGTNFFNELQTYQVKIANNELDPLDAFELKRTLKNFGAQNMDDRVGQKALQTGNAVAQNMDLSLSDSGAYRTLNGMYSKFLDAGPETLLNKGVSQENSQRYFSETNRVRAKVFDELNNIVQNSGAGNAAGDASKSTLRGLVQNLGDYDAQYPGLLKNLGLDKDAFAQTLKDTADQTNISKVIRGQEASMQNPTRVVGNLLGKGVYGVSNLAGRALSAGDKMASSSMNLPRTLYNATDDQLTNIAEVLTGRKATQSLGQGLKDALTNNDAVKRNAIIFTMLQRPEIRQMLATEGQ